MTWFAPLSNGGATITNYRIYRGTSSGAETLLTTVGNVLAYTDTTIVFGTTYFYELRAVNAAGDGPLSTELSITPRLAPGAPVLDPADLR